MRHVLANIFTYALVGALIIGSALFAWARSAQLVIATAADTEPNVLTEKTDLGTANWVEFGRHTYRVNCQNCHTVDGSGRGMYPPIQRMTAHLDAPGGRDYLIDLVLYGVYTETYGAPMPPMSELSDIQIAAVTNYILTEFAAADQAPDSTPLYLASEVAARRGKAMSEWEVARSRPAIPSARELGRGVKVPLGTDAPAVPEGKDE